MKLFPFLLLLFLSTALSQTNYQVIQQIEGTEQMVLAIKFTRENAWEF